MSTSEDVEAARMTNGVHVPPESRAKQQKILFLREALEAYRKGYATLSDDWKNLDTKAQGTVTIAGIFLAGAFGFVKTLVDRQAALAAKQVCIPLTSHCTARSDIENPLLALGVLTLFATIALAVASLRVRFAPALFGDQVNTMASDAVRLLGEDSDRELEEEFVGEQTRAWQEAVGGLTDAYNKKATKLIKAQYALVLGAVIVTVLTIIELLTA